MSYRELPPDKDTALPPGRYLIDIGLPAPALNYFKRRVDLAEAYARALAREYPRARVLGAGVMEITSRTGSKKTVLEIELEVMP